MLLILSANKAVGVGIALLASNKKTKSKDQLIGLRENLQETPIYHGKIYGFL